MTARPRTTLKMHGGMFLVSALFGVAQLWAQEAAPVPAPMPDSTVFGLTPGQWVLLIVNGGFGSVFLYHLLNAQKRTASLEDILRRYDETQKAHLEAFKDITANYRELNREAQNAMLLNVQVQTRLVEKLDRMERDYDKHGGQHERG